ncbi:MAG: arsenite methyltransferase [Bacteroidota bacterium]
MKNEQIKAIVKEKYSELAVARTESCCNSGGDDPMSIMSDKYDQLQGYHADADLGLGCGLPTEFAQIKQGDIVLDLGSGAGNDCFVARHETGPEGKVMGVDFSPEMIQRARQNASQMGYHNMEFREGDIENLPIEDNSIDVIVSNCVLNLVPDKVQVFQEIHRVLKPGGHFSISDIVLEGELPSGLQDAAELYAGCVAGASQKADYMNIIANTAFEDVQLQKVKPIILPDELLNQFLSPEQVKSYHNSNLGILSITVFGRKRGGVPQGETTKKDKTASSWLPGCCG